MARVESNIDEVILGVYEVSMHSVSLAERILEKDYKKVSKSAIERCWEGLETVTMHELVKNKIKLYAEEHNNDPYIIANCLIQDFRDIILGYSMSPSNVKIQMRKIGLKPKLRPRGGESKGRYNFCSGACPKRIGKKSAGKEYFFSGSPDLL